ncbi:MAG: efflux RND transporter periplasmic adaptor subunit [Rikenellaceae bacterium]
MTKKNVIIGAIVVAVVAVAAIFLFPKGQKGDNVTWITDTVEEQQITESVTATGTIEPVTLVDVGTQVSGILTTLYVDYNSVVTKGQVIAELDKSTLLLTRNTNRDNVASAKSKLTYEESNYKRTKALYDKGLIADAEYDLALYEYESAQNSYEVAKNNLEVAETNLGYATIYSPIDGVVLSRSVEEGQTVASSYSTPTLFTIAADLTDLRVIVDVDEADIGNVKEGQRASFSVDAFPLDTFEGVVTQVRQEGIEESNVITYEVVISAANPDLKLKPGLTANVEIFTMDETCECVVSVAALSFTPPTPDDAGEVDKAMMHAQDPMGGGGRPGGMGGGAGMGGGRPEGAGMGAGMARQKRVAAKRGDMGTVWVLVDGKPQPRRVEVGVTNGILTEIKGIEQGTEVITSMEFDVEPTTTKSSSSTTSSPFVQKRPGQK